METPSTPIPEPIEDKVEKIASVLTAPHVLMRPVLCLKGSRWCALYGPNIREGIVGYGETPEEACTDFDRVWRDGAMRLGAAGNDLARLEVARLNAELDWLRERYARVVTEYNDLLESHREIVYARDGELPEELEAQTALLPRYVLPTDS